VIADEKTAKAGENTLAILMRHYKFIVESQLTKRVQYFGLLKDVFL